MKKIISIVLLALITLASFSVIAQNENVPILLYHNIDNKNHQNKLLHITPDGFREHMEALVLAGYNTITYQEYKEAVIGLNDLPKNPIIISFDDGYLSNYKYAFPLLKELNLKATIFIVTSSVGNDELIFPHFDWEQAKEMQQSGYIDIQSHSHTHRDFSTLNKEETLYEIRMSKYLIEKNLGKNINVFAYPYGIDNIYSQDIIKAAGYDTINYVGNKGSNGLYDGLDKLKRITISGDYTASDLLDIITQNLNY